MEAAFMVPGHGKFKPDIIMAGMARKYYRSDVFTIRGFAELCREYGEVILIGFEEPNILMDFKRELPSKYSSLPGTGYIKTVLIKSDTK